LKIFRLVTFYGQVLDEEAIRQAPYLAIDSWVLENLGNNHHRWDNWVIPHSLTCDSEKSEMHILVTGELLDWDTMSLARQRGYIISVDNNIGPIVKKGPVVERIKRWYSMGKIHVADFDGDNGVDQDDANKFLAVWLANRDQVNPQRALTVFATGDINGDGHVDDDDYAKYFAYVATVDPDTNRLGNTFDYGEANLP
jgi:hypothetical protein